MAGENLGNKNFNEKLKSPDHVLIDVRTPDEYNLGHLTGAKLIDFYSDDFLEEISKLDKNKKYLLYCRTGNRSGQTMRVMSQMGFNEVYNLENGIVGWMEDGFEIETE